MMIECDIMKNNKGQALVEFIIVLPIFLLILISIIDFGNIISKKYSLENDLDTVVDLYNSEEYSKINEYADSKDIKLSYKEENDFLVINLNKNIKITSPMLSVIFGKTYDISTSKSIYKNE